MATPIRFAPVLIGKEAEEFYERWLETIDKPDPSYSKEEDEKRREYFRKLIANGTIK
ncbi:MAG: hypothetical protein LBE56_11050 [Tannerella sp.]|jgi:CRISPR/Cas system CSM-associated protein Csm2 small subunit|nr:hypothetical protein [Tannerella sp.]